MSSPAEPLLEVHGLRTHFPFGNRWLGTRGVVKAVDGVDLVVRRGEVLGLVGESGSGKTTVGRSVLRLVEPTAGFIRFDGVDLMAQRGAELRRLRRRMQIVFQNPYGSLSPRMQVQQILAEPLKLHGIVPDAAIGDRVLELLKSVGLEPYFRYRYPHEMSGGQRQRIAIARALALEPDFIVADEPVSALDVSVQAGILSILVKLQRTTGVALLLISHDLAVVERLADRVAVMYHGRIVEEGPVDTIISDPQHPYTQVLMEAVTRRAVRGLMVGGAARDRDSLGCAFAPRCSEAQNICRKGAPALGFKWGRQVACHLR